MLPRTVTYFEHLARSPSYCFSGCTPIGAPLRGRVLFSSYFPTGITGGYCRATASQSEQRLPNKLAAAPPDGSLVLKFSNNVL